MSTSKDTPDTPAERIARLCTALEQYHPQFFPDLRETVQTVNQLTPGDLGDFRDAARWFEERYQAILWEFSRPWQFRYVEALTTVMLRGQFGRFARIMTRHTIERIPPVRGRLVAQLRDYGETLVIAGLHDEDWQEWSEYAGQIVRSVHLEVIFTTDAARTDVSTLVEKLLDEAYPKSVADAGGRVLIGPPGQIHPGTYYNYARDVALYAAQHNRRLAKGKYKDMVASLRTGTIFIPGWDHLPIPERTVNDALLNWNLTWLEPGAPAVSGPGFRDGLWPKPKKRNARKKLPVQSYHAFLCRQIP